MKVAALCLRLKCDLCTLFKERSLYLLHAIELPSVLLPLPVYSKTNFRYIFYDEFLRAWNMAGKIKLECVKQENQGNDYCVDN